MSKSSDNEKLRQAAGEGCLLLNEAIRELVTPLRVVELSAVWEKLNPIPVNAIAAVRNMVLRSVIVNIYRLKETRDNFLVGWLFSDEELRKLGFPPVEEFIGAENWKSFELVRHQYAGHATSKKATTSRPGRIIPPAILGTALRAAGLIDSERLLRRVKEELVPGVEKVRDELTRLHPFVEKFVKETYPLELERAMLEKPKGSSQVPTVCGQ